MAQLTNIQIIQRIETLFSPGKDWETANFYLSTAEVSLKLIECFPDLSVDQLQLHEILKEIHVPYQLNEHNQKHYWLLNLPAVV